MLVGARQTWLSDALSEPLEVVDPRVLKEQIAAYAPADAQQLLAVAGVRDEYIFPTPVVLEAKPTLVGYYRLLLALPQETFYGVGTGMGEFKSMETRGLLTRVDCPTSVQRWGSRSPYCSAKCPPQ